MTRRSVYSLALMAFVATSAMTIASVVSPRWISWDVSIDDDLDPTAPKRPVHYTYGLHSRCNSITGSCDFFPDDGHCRADRTFCSMWRSIGFLMSFAVVIEGMCLVAFFVMVAGGKQKRESGWRVVCAFLGIAALIQCAAMSLMAYVYDNDDRFFPGWNLDSSWYLCTISWIVQLLTAIGLAASAFFLPPEAGYELIPDPHQQ